MDDATEEKKKLEERREARRKRILLNAENRLKLITGSSEEITTIPVEVESVQKIVKNISTEKICELEEPNRGCVNSFPVNSYNEEQEAIINNTVELKQNVKETKSVTLLTENYNVLLVIISILTCLVSHIGFNFYTDQSVFMPFFLFEVILLFFKSTESQTNSMLRTVLLLSNLNPQLVQGMLFAMKRFECLVKDFSIYFFTFLMFNICFEIVL